MQVAPADRITPQHVQDYVVNLRCENADFTVLCRIQELYDAIRVIAPDRNWTWLRRVQNALRSRSTPVRDKLSRMKPAAALIQLGKALIRGNDPSRVG
jgi:hypothetical protein